MDNPSNNQVKVVVSAEVFPYEKEAYKKWWQGKFHSEADAIRCHIRKVTGLDPESQEKKVNSP
ncbi:MAG TPA: hypothetical protein VMW10_11405 [Alphaproteobacteria bacterium]|nr:hypothetical protein [Alphaproteobacteria bacterium]